MWTFIFANHSDALETLDGFYFLSHFFMNSEAHCLHQALDHCCLECVSIPSVLCCVVGITLIIVWDLFLDC